MGPIDYNLFQYLVNIKSFIKNQLGFIRFGRPVSKSMFGSWEIVGGLTSPRGGKLLASDPFCWETFSSWWFQPGWWLNQRI